MSYRNSLQVDKAVLSVLEDVSIVAVSQFNGTKEGLIVLKSAEIVIKKACGKFLTPLGTKQGRKLLEIHRKSMRTAPMR